MKKGLMILMVAVMVFALSAVAWCDVKTDIQNGLLKFYNDIETGNTDDMKNFLTYETTQKTISASTTNVMGNLDAIFGLAQSVKKGDATIYISGVKFNFLETTPDKVVVRTTFKMAVDREGKTINNDGKHEIVLLKEKNKWYIMNLTDQFSSLK